VTRKPEPVFFLDRNFGRRFVPDALRQAGYSVEAMDDHFPPDTADEFWLRQAGERG
jgi:hypothetical protein